jgi:hypothetical protein
MLWDRGTWRPEPATPDVDAALAKGELKFTLDGVKLKGSWVLVRTRGGPPARDGSGESRSWLLLKHRDEWAGAGRRRREVRQEREELRRLRGHPRPGQADVWESHRPAEGGAAGKMLREIIAKAAKLKAGAESQKRAKPPKKSTATVGAAAPRKRASAKQ